MEVFKYFGTFMMRQAFKRSYVQINAVDMADARAAMFEHFGDKFFTVYEEKDFVDQTEQYNLTKLCEITAVNHISSMSYNLIAVGENDN